MSDKTSDGGQEASRLVVELAKRFVTLVGEVEPHWRRAFYRFVIMPGENGSNGSYETEDECHILDTVTNSNAFRELRTLAKALFATMNKKSGLLLLIMNSDFSYEIKFEYDNPQRWIISKMDGLTGVPVGLE